jgi:hypothetical protein
LLTDLCRVNLAGDFVFRGNISGYFWQDEQSKSKSVTPLVSSIISKEGARMVNPCTSSWLIQYYRERWSI